MNQDALSEYDAITTLLPAEFGRTTGGLVNMASKSGGNELHGTVVYDYRGADLTALDPFGNQAVGEDQQISATLGGPITKDRTFFFIAPQVQIANKPVQIDYANLQSQGLLGTPAANELLSVAPEGTSNAEDNSQSVISRLDHQFSDRESFFGRFDFTHAVDTSLTGSDGLMSGPSITSVTTSALSNQTLVTVWSGTLMGQLTSVVSPHMLNELQLQFSREDIPRLPEGNGPQVTVENGGATVAVYGPQATGVSFGNGAFPNVNNRNEVEDNYSIVSGAHTTKFGVDLLHIATDMTYSPGENGSYVFTSLANWAAVQPFSYMQFTGSGALRTSMDQLGFYLEDTWRVLPTVTVSPGFRYEAELNPDYLPATDPQDRAPGATNIPDDLTEWEPRLGVAWDVFGNTKTVVRAGGGIYYAPTQMPEFAQALLFNGGNPNLGLGYAVASTTASEVTSAFSSAGINLANANLANLPELTAQQYQTYIQQPGVGESVYYMSPNFQNARSLQWEFSVDQTLARGITLTEGLMYINTVHIAQELDMNLGTPTPDATGRLIYPSTRPLSPQFDEMIMADSDAKALYEASVTTLNIQRKHYNLDFNYTLGWNRSEADHERPVGAISYDSLADLNNEYGWSNLDMRDMLTATDTVYLPFGFQLSTSLRYNSPRPFSATTGTDSNNDGQLNDRPLLDGAVQERNIYRNTSFFDTDLRLSRQFHLPRERGVITVSADFFNLFNNANVQLASTALVYGNNGTVLQNGQLVQLPPQAAFDLLKNPATGQYYTYNTPGDPFQAQLGVRFEF